MDHLANEELEAKTEQYENETYIQWPDTWLQIKTHVAVFLIDMLLYCSQISELRKNI